MNKQEQLNSIRESCATVNPDSLLEQTGESEWSFKREIRLSDVLLAIGSKFPNKPPYPKEQYWAVDYWGNFIDENLAGRSKWNLLKDSLGDQSSETIEFIFNLLK